MLNFIQICFILLNMFTILASTNAENTKNKDPFVKIGSKYYFINETLKMNWFAAGYYCRSYGADLAHIESLDELLALQEYILSRNALKQLWIDGNDLAKEGEYISHTTGRPLAYTKWLRNNPDNSNNEDCIQLREYEKQFLMNDNSCGAEISAICQYRESSTDCSAKNSLPNQNENCMLRHLAEAFTRAADMCNSCSQPVLRPTT